MELKQELEASQGKIERNKKVEISKKVETMKNKSEIERLRQVESLKTVIKTWASKFSEVKTSIEKDLFLSFERQKEQLKLESRSIKLDY